MKTKITIISALILNSSIFAANYIMLIDNKHYKNNISIQNYDEEESNHEVTDIEYDPNNLGGLTIDENGFISGQNSYFTLFVNNKKISPNEKKYLEWEYQTGGNAGTRIGIGFSTDRSRDQDHWIGSNKNSFAYWGYVWTGGITSGSNSYTDSSINPIMGMALDYTKTPLEISIYVNGNYQYTNTYTGEQSDLYLGSSRYYSIPPYRINVGQALQYLPEGYQSF